MSSNDTHRYDDIINLPHHEPTTHPRMPKKNRAAQFSPFAALTGYDEAIREKARLTEDALELSDDIKDLLDAKFSLIKKHIKENLEIAITYFSQDEKKAGGRYVTVSGSVKKIDVYGRMIILTDGTKIPIDCILDIDGDLFEMWMT